MAIAILNITPTCRIVASVAEATPHVFALTELMTACVLGEEKQANQKPRTIRLIKMNPIAVFWFNKVRKISPTVLGHLITLTMMPGLIAQVGEEIIEHESRGMRRFIDEKYH